MKSYKSQKVDLSQDYPCPCRCKGSLSRIVLTDALGCDRCQQIFVLADEGRTLEKLISHYPYKQAWRWTGSHWSNARNGWRESFLSLAFLSIAALLFLWLPLARLFSGQILLWVLIAFGLVMLPALHMWLSCRR
ncbi:MAG: MFS transporter [Synechococcales cyanobacterium RU_4_20]|nr:MFS transporter [Synechococcales cyanobacterium RU_4_20]NJR69548.1 MFS transporter [Synechococcales cyanobacterium CRU_2_2]